MIVLPWHNLVLLAEQAASPDLVSNGRFRFRHRATGYRHNELQASTFRSRRLKSALRGASR